MCKTKIPRLKVIEFGGDAFDVDFADPDCKGKVTLPGTPPASDTDLIRLLVECHKKQRASRALQNFINGVLSARDDVVVRDRRWSHNEVRNAFEGLPDKELPPLPPVKFELCHRRAAKYAYFADFNPGPHLCVDVPDGHFTVTCRTSEGKKITFAFCPYTEGGPPQCVDVLHHTSGVTVPNGALDCPVQELVAFTPGRDLVRTNLADGKPCTLLTVLLATKEERAAGKMG